MQQHVPPLARYDRQVVGVMILPVAVYVMDYLAATQRPSKR